MNNTYAYSAKENGFFIVADREIYERSAQGWPDDAIDVRNSDYTTLRRGMQAGKIVVLNAAGYPVLTEPEADYAALAELTRQQHLLSANEMTADWRTELQLDMIDDDGKARLAAWMNYIRALKAMTFEAVTDKKSWQAIVWPEAPAA